MIAFTRIAIARSVATCASTSSARSLVRRCVGEVASTTSLRLTTPSLRTPPSPAVTALRHFSHATRPTLCKGNDAQQDRPAAAQLSEEPIEPRLSLTFTCTVENCGHRSTHEFTKRSYERGIVLVQCPNCKNRHLIADHLSWFTETSDEPKTIEQIVAAKGGRVRRGVQVIDGKGYETVEILSDSDDDSTGSASAPLSIASDAQNKGS